ncbi:hypothetical protein [Brevibacillus massiliensis]|jgi:hypothetical protein|uniref:hypothetical protein n=1 Tax=Brevibacillus massiliensis TaxID=1118054 RepID=UPI0002F2813C|nr:hypothetical protein [Brevibacillus massiliensis]
MISDAFFKLRRQLLLALVPIVLDLFGFLVGLAVYGFSGGSKLTLKLTLNIGLPSVSSLLDRQFMPGGIQFNFSEAAPFAAILLFVLFMMLSAFFQGGFISLLQKAAEDRRISLEHFFRGAVHYFARFFVLQLLIMLVFLAAGGLFLITLGLVGGLLFLVVFLWLRILFVYLEFTIVTDDLSLAASFGQARHYFRRRLPDTAFIIIAIIACAAVFALLINGLWFPLPFLILLIAYDFVASGLQLALMLSLLRIRG